MALPVLPEEWRPLVGWEGKYWVSNLGRVKGRKGILQQRTSPLGYKTVSIERGKKGIDRISMYKNVHRAVAEAFIPNPNSLPQVNHIDEDPSNNRVDNLEWCTAKYNMNYGEGAKTRHKKIDYSKQERKDLARINGAKTTSKEVIQLTKEGVEVKRFSSLRAAGRALGIDPSHIGAVANGSKVRSTAGGFKWSFAKGGVL